MTVSTLLAQQPEDVLVEMRDNLRAEIARLETEADLVEQALSRRYRRGSKGSSPNGRTRQLKRSDVLQLLRAENAALSPAEVRNRFAQRGIQVTANAVRNHLRRLVDDGELTNPREGLYAAKRTEFRPAPVTGDDETHSWEPSS